LNIYISLKLKNGDNMNSETIFSDEMKEAKKLKGAFKGAAVTACIKRYKFNKFVEFMQMQEIAGVLELNDITLTLARRISKETVGRSFGQNQMLKHFSKKGRSAAEKSELFDLENREKLDNLLNKLKNDWLENWNYDLQKQIQKKLIS